MSFPKISLRLPMVFALFILPRCTCPGEDLTRLPEPKISLENETGETHIEATPWLQVNFGDVDSGGTATKRVVVENVGTGSLEIDSACLVEATTIESALLPDNLCVAASSVFAMDPLAGEVIEGGAQVERVITFRPPAGGLHSYFLRVESNDETEPRVAAELLGRGTAGRLCADELVLDFGSIEVGSSDNITASLRNCGGKAVTVNDVAFLSNPDDVFDVTVAGAAADTAVGTILEPDDELFLSVEFAPTVARSYRDALAGLYQVAVDGAETEEFTLTFNGDSVTPPVCRLTVTPESVQFGAVASGESLDRDVDVISVGACACRVDAITGPSPTDAGFSLVDAPALPFWLAGTSGCDSDPAEAAGAPNAQAVTVRFSAGNGANAMQSNGTMEFATSDEAEPTRSIALEATGGGTPFCQLDVAPEGGNGLDIIQLQNRWGLAAFGQVTIYGTKRLPIALKNIGNTNCTINKIALDFEENTTTNEFSLAHLDGTPVNFGATNITVAPGDTQTYLATFSPTHVIEPSGGRLPAFAVGGLSVAIDVGAITRTVPAYCSFNDHSCNGVTSTTTDSTSIAPGTLHQQGDFSIGFSGTPVEPAIDVLPGEIDFGEVTLGCGSSERYVNIYNTGTGTLVIEEPFINPAVTPADFEITGTSQSNITYPYSIVAGDALTVFVRMQANQESLTTGELVIPVNQENGTAPPVTIPLRGTGTTNIEATDIFDQFDEAKTDVLFVVDDSGSMDPFLQAMAQNFGAFFTATNVADSAFHIAVTTTLTTGENCLDPFGNQTCPLDEMAGFSTACAGNDKFLNPSSVDPDAQFQCNVDVDNAANVNPSRPGSDAAEGGLQAARVFLEEPNVSDPSINGGFLREDAKLHVIMVSDEVDQSEGPAALYVDFFRNLKGPQNSHLVNVSAIAAPAQGCTIPSGEFLEGDARYSDVVDELGGKFQPICDPDWTVMMQNLGLASLALQEAFVLSRPADASTVETCVTEDGSATCVSVPASAQGAGSGYWLDTNTNSIVFQGSSIPPRSSQVRVDYQAQCF